MIALIWGLQTPAIAFAMVFEPEYAVSIVTAVAALAPVSGGGCQSQHRIVTVRNLSTVAGLQLLAENPYAELERAMRRRARKGRGYRGPGPDDPEGVDPT